MRFGCSTVSISGIPGVDLQHPHLHEADDRGDRVGDQILTELGLLLDAHASQRPRRPHLRVLHEEALARDPFRAANQCERRPATCGTIQSAMLS
jgi:hypothetical protein